MKGTCWVAALVVSLTSQAFADKCEMVTASDISFKVNVKGKEIKAGMGFLEVLNVIGRKPDDLTFDKEQFTARYAGLERFTVHCFVFAANGKLDYVAMYSD